MFWCVLLEVVDLVTFRKYGIGYQKALQNSIQTEILRVCLIISWGPTRDMVQCQVYDPFLRASVQVYSFCKRRGFLSSILLVESCSLALRTDLCFVSVQGNPRNKSPACRPRSLETFLITTVITLPQTFNREI